MKMCMARGSCLSLQGQPEAVTSGGPSSSPLPCSPSQPTTEDSRARGCCFQLADAVLRAVLIYLGDSGSQALRGYLLRLYTGGVTAILPRCHAARP